MNTILIAFIIILSILIISLIVFYKKIFKPSIDLQMDELAQIRNKLKEFAKEVASKKYY